VIGCQECLRNDLNGAETGHR